MIKQIINVMIGMMLAQESTLDGQMGAIRRAMFWQNVPTECPKCNTPLVFNYYKTKEKGFEYYGVKCTGTPVHQLNFHEYQDKSSFYLTEKELSGQEGWTTYDPANYVPAGESGQNGQRDPFPPQQPMNPQQQFQQPAPPPNVAQFQQSAAPFPQTQQITQAPPQPSTTAPFQQNQDMLAAQALTKNIVVYDTHIQVGAFKITQVTGEQPKCECGSVDRQRWQGDPCIHMLAYRYFINRNV